MTAHLPNLRNYREQPGFRFTDERVICGECAGAGYFYASQGPSGATIDCTHCDGEGGWLAEPFADLNTAHERFIDGAETFAPAPPPVLSAHSLGVVLSMLLAIGAVVALLGVVL